MKPPVSFSDVPAGSPSGPDDDPLEEKKRRLDSILSGLGSALVAYSGGVDSAYLLKAATERLGERAVGVIAVSPSLPRAELDEAVHLAAEMGCRLEIVNAFELANPDYAANTPDRCYFCKTELFSICGPLAARLNLAHVVYGANRDDLGDLRPGMRAASERGIRAPLLEAGLDKTDIRELARSAGIRIWDKPAFACLASRIPHGTPVTAERLARVEAAESFLRAAGFRQFRVRDLDGLARIEVWPEDVGRLGQEPLRSQLEGHLNTLGFSRVFIDPDGYRQGKLSTAGPSSEGLRTGEPGP